MFLRKFQQLCGIFPVEEAKPWPQEDKDHQLQYTHHAMLATAEM